MIKQAHSYLVGALSGVTLIGIAIAVFVVLVSAQVFHEIPIVNVASTDHKADAVSRGRALTAGGGATTATTGGATKKSAHSRAGSRNGGAIAAAPHSGNTGSTQNGTATEPGAIAVGTGPATAVESSPSTGGGGTRSSGGISGSHSSQPSTNSPSHSPSSAESGAGAGTTSGTSSSSGSTGASSGSSGTTAGSAGSSSGGTSTGTTGNPVTATTKPSKDLEETVDGTVGTVNEVTGGALESTGVPEVTEKVTESVVGPESVVGKTVEGVAEAVGGLLAH